MMKVEAMVSVYSSRLLAVLTLFFRVWTSQTSFALSCTGDPFAFRLDPALRTHWSFWDPLSHFQLVTRARTTVLYWYLKVLDSYYSACYSFVCRVTSKCENFVHATRVYKPSPAFTPSFLPSTTILIILQLVFDSLLKPSSHNKVSTFIFISLFHTLSHWNRSMALFTNFYTAVAVAVSSLFIAAGVWATTRTFRANSNPSANTTFDGLDQNLNDEDRMDVDVEEEDDKMEVDWEEGDMEVDW